MRHITFPSGHRSAALAVLLPLILVACGGGAATTVGPAAATPTHAPATAAGAATNAPAATPADAPTSAATAATSSAEACALLTVEEVAAAYGQPLDTAEPSADDLYSYCKYTGDDEDAEVTTYVGKSADASLSVFNTMKINDGEAVSGVGDEAYWSTDSFAPGIYFLKGGMLGFISGSVFGPEESIVALGALLASRM